MADLRTDTIYSFDGTELATYQYGDAGSWICLSSGLGGSSRSWRPFVEHFKPHHRIMNWDYRGLFRSGPSADPLDLGVETQARDLVAVMDAMGIESAVHVGWSMGVQVALELCRQAPQRVDGLVLIGGSSGKPFDTIVGGGPWAGLVRPTIDRLQSMEAILGPLASKAVPVVSQLLQLLKLTGIVNHNADDEVLRDVVEDWVGLDFHCYWETFKALGNHDASSVLPSIDVPTLVMVGDRDLFTPVAVSQVMHEQVKDSELLVIRQGTHYVPIEFPDLINLRIEKFFRQRLGDPS
jgi:pimeloyl-ACP methyl ester carboxylesterase